MRKIFSIGLGAADEPGDADSMGFKAYHLARMARLGLPVPQAFVLGTAWCRDGGERPNGKSPGALHTVLKEQMHRLEVATGLVFGGARKPLLVSVRSGAPVSMPGMMDTLLDIGLCDATLRALLRLTGNPRLVWDSYRRLVQQFAEVVHGANPAPFRAAAAIAMDRAGVANARELDFQCLERLTRDYLELFRDLTGHHFPQEPYAQLDAAVAAVFASWCSERAVEYRRLGNIDDSIGTAVTVQRMVFGNAGSTSGAGVAFTRDPASGENRLYLDFLFNAQGEDVVSGRFGANDAERLAQVLPQVLGQLQDVRRVLEQEFRDCQEFEFTVQDSQLYLLQTRSAKRTPWAALRIAVEQVCAGLIPPEAGLERLAGIDLERLQRRRLVCADGAALLSKATSASPGVATGAIALDAAALERLRGAGQPTILVRSEIATADIAAIAAAEGVLSVQGARTSHAAVVARQLGKVCLVGCTSLRINERDRSIGIGERTLREGEVITLDGTGGQVFAGETQATVERPDAWLLEVDRWRQAIAR